MANTLINASMIVGEGLRLLHNKSAFLGRINTQYKDDFKTKGGAKPGDTVNIRVPSQFTVRDGPVANLQDVNQRTIPLTIQPEFGIDIAISDFDLTLKIEDFSETVLRPQMNRLATELDFRVATRLYRDAFNSVGTPGSPPATQDAAQLLALQANEKLTNNAAPSGYDERMMMLSPSATTKFVSKLNAGFNSQTLIGEQYKTGQMGVALGFTWNESQNMPNHTVGPQGGTPLVNGANQGLINAGTTDNPQAATTSLVTNGWTAAAALRMKRGDIFTIAGVNAVNPETKADTGTLQQFVATADVSSDGAGNATIIASPAIVAGGAYQNVTARPASGAAITVLGAANSVTSQSVGFVKDAFTLATVDMEVPNNMDMAAQKTFGGVSMRFLRGFDIVNNRRICRFDILAGFATLRPEWACRVQL